MSSLFDRNYECPACGRPFTSKQVRTSAIRTKARQKDFHATFHGENPTYYGVICCPNCGFAKFEKDFKQGLNLKEKKIIESIIKANWNAQDFTGERDVESAIRVHKIALASYKVLGEQNSILAKLYLRLAWFNREAGNTSEEKKYDEQALQAFISAYETEKFDEIPEKEIEIIYLIGELNRQLENYKEAIRWFDMTVRHEMIFKNRLLKQYAKDQWALAAEENAEKKRSNQ
jgi:uncharacterized protein (DUF2225 family)